MRDYTSLRHRKRSPWTLLLALALCVALSTGVLISRLSHFTNHTPQQYIPLTVSSGTTQVTTSRGQLASVRMPALYAPHPALRLDETQPGELSWISLTELELFCASYENGTGQVTVKSASGDNVVAPGTGHAFTFALLNTGDQGLDYDIEVEAYFAIEGGNEKVPVQIRLFDHNGNYLIGSPEQFEDLSDVNIASGSGSVSAGYMVPYTIEWMWPFEGDDILDTSLGNYFLQTDAEVSFVMEVRTVAELGGEGGLPDTGDRRLVVPVLLLVSSSTAMVLMLIPVRRKREEEPDAQ